MAAGSRNLQFLPQPGQIHRAATVLNGASRFDVLDSLEPLHHGGATLLGLRRPPGRSVLQHGDRLVDVLPTSGMAHISARTPPGRAARRPGNADLRSAPRGSAKPAPMTLRHANVSSPPSPNPGCRDRSPLPLPAPFSCPAGCTGGPDHGRFSRRGPAPRPDGAAKPHQSHPSGRPPLERHVPPTDPAIATCSTPADPARATCSPVRSRYCDMFDPSRSR